MFVIVFVQGYCCCLIVFVCRRDATPAEQVKYWSQKIASYPPTQRSNALALLDGFINMLESMKEGNQWKQRDDL